LIKSYAS
jgi:hypothetical protein